MELGLVSVIIPVYNVENYIGRCIESVLLQTYKNFELLLIDDGSTDNSYKVCTSYERKYRNVTTIRQANSGPGAARNTGIMHASGEFIIFMDSDDSIDKDHISNLLKAHKRNNTLVLCGYKRIYKDYIKKSSPGNTTLSKNDFELLIDEWLIDPMIGSPCNKLMEAKIIKDNNLKYPENLIFAEDFIFSLKLFDAVDTIITIGNCSYNYYKEIPDSLTTINDVDVEKWWDSEKYVYQQIQTCDFLTDSFLQQKILCFLVLLNFISQIRKSKSISNYLLEDISNNDEYKHCLRNIKDIRMPFLEKSTETKRRFLYKLIRLMFLTNSVIVKNSIIAFLKVLTKVY